MCGRQGHQQWDCPQDQQGKAGKGIQGQDHRKTPKQQQQSTSGPAQHTRSKATGMAPASATPRASGYKTASKAVVTETEPAAPEASTQNGDDYVHICVTQRRWRQWMTGSQRRCSTRFPRALGHRMQNQFFTPFQCSRRHPRPSSGVKTPATFIPRVSRSCSLADVVTRAWIR